MDFQAEIKGRNTSLKENAVEAMAAHLNDLEETHEVPKLTLLWKSDVTQTAEVNEHWKECRNIERNAQLISWYCEST